ncbi:MAG TPA: hypothetical protein DE045_01660 [Oceanospirillaceae bacterium]|nr:hypothetical protein [Oceanospirillaceae bacterium]
MEVQGSAAVTNAAVQQNRVIQAEKLEHGQDLQAIHQIVKVEDSVALADRRSFTNTQASLTDAIDRLNAALRQHQINGRREDQFQKQNTVLRDIKDYMLKTEMDRVVDSVA